ncbi:MAG: histidinol-phosphatase [Clostridia bacterium]|nr:histidinol-phosphatase [Clostridia bacterium]
MLYNYHTHTARCNHALGNDREYVEQAIAGGMKTLGFSDHAPYLFPDNTPSLHRMRTDELFAYAVSIRALAKEYEKDIRILCGFELEYYPDYHAEEMKFLSQIQPDYLILGQHFIGNEYSFIPSSRGLAGNDLGLIAYVSQAIAGLATGDFLYLAHPDIAGTNFSDETFEREYRRLCVAAKKFGVPLEINLLGVRGKRHYPCERFFRIAAEVGNDVVLGADAHDPKDVCEQSGEEKARAMVKKLGLKLLEKLDI